MEIFVNQEFELEQHMVIFVFGVILSHNFFLGNFE